MTRHTVVTDCEALTRVPGGNVAVLSTKQIRDSRLFVQISGELDAVSRPDVERALYEMVETADVTVDLTRAEFVDLGSIRMLAACRERANAAGFNFRVLNGPRHVRRMLDMLDRSPYRRPEQPVHGEMPALPAQPLTTTTDKERSRPESEQIVRLQCELCGHPTFRPEGAPFENCPECGGPLRPVAIFRDRRRVDRPVEQDRRQDN